VGLKFVRKHLRDVPNPHISPSFMEVGDSI
jgi:hypothetical protein